jgi:hypothetical protein
LTQDSSTLEDLNVWMFECLCPLIAGLKDTVTKFNYVLALRCWNDSFGDNKTNNNSSSISIDTIAAGYATQQQQQQQQLQKQQQL